MGYGDCRILPISICHVSYVVCSLPVTIMTTNWSLMVLKLAAFDYNSNSKLPPSARPYLLE